MRAILLNGPPGSGKDTLGGILWSRIRFSRCVKLAQPIIDFMLREYRIDMAKVAKDEPHPALGWRTPRQVAIRYSEGFCKPLFGVDYFGVAAVNRLQEMDRCGEELAIFTDSGFVSEAEPLLNHLGIGNVMQIHLTRPGHHFQGDSRGHWRHAGIGCIEFDNNASDIISLATKAQQQLMPEIDQWLIHSS